MPEYIEREKAFNALLKLVPKVDDDGYCWVVRGDAATAIDSIPAADVLPRDEAIKMGAELAAMHGSDAASQQLEEAYLKGVEYGMTRRDVRPVVRGKWIKMKFFHDWECEKCGSVISGNTPDPWNHYHFCPNCGADMREES